MPIQIKELIIKATVDENSSAEGSANQGAAKGSKESKNQERIIRQCVDEVLEVLRLREER